MFDEKSCHCHDDLLDEDSKVIHDFCAHIYIAKKGGMCIIDEKELIASGDKNPIMRSATVTFIEYEGKNYGITCSHVLNTLNKINKKMRLN
jgi:hypothetical protein